MIRSRGKSYQVLVYDPACKKKVVVGTRGSMKAARALEREKATEFVEREQQRSTVAAFVERWLYEKSRTWRDTSLRTNENATRRLVRDFGDRELGGITKSEAAAWAVANPACARASRACFTYAVQLGLLAQNPFAQLGVIRVPRRQIAPDWLTRADVEAIADAARQYRGDYGNHFAALILFAAYTCIRPAELFALDWSDVDWDAQEVSIRGQWRRDKTFGPTKNGQARTIVMPPPAAAALAAMPRFTDDSVFHTVGGHRFNHSSLRPYWREVRRGEMDIYELRHFGATYLLDELGLSEYDVSIQMGHTDGGKLVREVYGHRSHARARDRIKMAWATQEELDRVPVLAV